MTGDQGWQYITVHSEFAYYVLWNKIVTYLNLIFEAYRNIDL